jgi:hypothetical protein
LGRKRHRITGRRFFQPLESLKTNALADQGLGPAGMDRMGLFEFRERFAMPLEFDQQQSAFVDGVKMARIEQHCAIIGE